MQDEIHTTTDLTIAIAESLNAQDPDRLDGLEATIMGWMQPEDEREAQLLLLAAAHSAIHKMA